MSAVEEEDESLVLGEFRRIYLEAAEHTLVRRRAALLEAAHTVHAAGAELLRRHKRIARILPVCTHAENPIVLRAILVIETCREEIEMNVAARAIPLESLAA